MTLVPVTAFPAPEELNTIWKLCERIANTEFVPRTLKGRPEAIACAVLFGRELGIGPMQALQSVQVIEGKPSASPELMRALILRAGHKLDIVSSPTSATISGERCDNGSKGAASFTVDDAVKAGLCRKGEHGQAVARSSNGKVLPWESYTEDMLVARATSRLARRLFSDVIAGVSYVPEEMASTAATAPSEPSAPIVDAEVTEPPHDALTGELEASLGAQGVAVPEPTKAPPAPRDTVRGPPSAVQALNAPLIHAALDNETAVASPGPDDVPLFGSDGIEPPEPPWERQVREDPAGTPATKASASRAQKIADRNAGKS